MNLKRLVLCTVLDIHVGNIETTRADTERHDLIVHFMPCKRCGRLVPLDIVPAHDIERYLNPNPREYGMDR